MKSILLFLNAMLCTHTFLDPMAGILSLLALGGGVEARGHIPGPDKPSIILVPGAFHKAKIYDKVVDLLYQHHYSHVFQIDLPSVGSLAGRDQDVSAVRTILVNELNDGRDVLLVGNSYGGTVIGEAIKGLMDYPRSCSRPSGHGNVLSRAASILNRGRHGGHKQCGKVIGLVFFAGYLPYIQDVLHPENKADVIDVSPSFFHFTLWGKVYSDGDANIPPSVSFYNDLSANEAAYWTSQLDFSSYDSLNATATYIPYTGDFECMYVIGDHDNSVPRPFAETFINQPGAQFQVETIHAGHVPMLGKPNEVANLIKKALGNRDNW